MTNKRKILAIKALAAVLSFCAVSSVYGNGTEVFDSWTDATSSGAGFVSEEHSTANKVDLVSQSSTVDAQKKSIIDRIRTIRDIPLTLGDSLATLLSDDIITKVVESAFVLQMEGKSINAEKLLGQLRTIKQVSEKLDVETWNKLGPWVQAALAVVDYLQDVSMATTDEERNVLLAQLVGAISANHLSSVITGALIGVLTEALLAAAVAIPALGTAVASAPVLFTVGIAAVAIAAGWGFTVLVKHAIDHPEDNGFAILINWFYDHSSIPAKISEWWYDVRFGDDITRAKRLAELVILINDLNPLTKIFTPLLKKIPEWLDSLRQSDLKYFDPSLVPSPVTPFDEVPPDINGPTPNPTSVPDSDGRFQGLKPIKLL